MEICPRCFSPMGDGRTCTKCGFSEATSKKYPGVLPRFTTLKNRYVIGEVLGRGGFGVTYSAMDADRSCLCAVKEYMPAEYAERANGGVSIHPYSDSKSMAVFLHCKERFKKEAGALETLKGNYNVVNIWDYFEQNGTAYLVMEFLKTTVKQLMREKGGRLPADVAYTMLVTIASSLMEIHRVGLLHRDITPENIMCPDDGSSGIFKLVDFGAARNASAEQKSVLLKKGYGPPEQYDSMGNQGPWTDIYALCATYYNVVSGQRLDDAMLRQRLGSGSLIPLHERNCGVSRELSEVINKGLALDYRKRQQSCKELLDDLSAATRYKPASGRQKTAGANHRETPCNAGSQALGQPVKGQIRLEIDEAGKKQALKAQNKDAVSSGSCSYSKWRSGAAGGNRKSRAAGISKIGSGAPLNKMTENKRKETAQKERVKPVVEIISGPAIGRCIALQDKQILKIGRSKIHSELTLDYDSNISRLHCTVRFNHRTKRFYVTDLSVNGTFFETGQRLTAQTEISVEPNTRLYLASKENMLQLRMLNE